MAEKNISQKVKFKNIDETRGYLIEEMKQNELISKKHKKVCKVLNYVEHLVILVSTVTESISISAFASLVGIPIGTASSAVEMEMRVKQLKKEKSRKKKKQDDKIVL